jgi:para-nitrobenzyl esterase
MRTTPGSSCPQAVGKFSPQPPFSEDCLFLNITTPVHPDGDDGDDGLPIWIFIHGGSLLAGAGAVYDPSVLVSTHKVIVVTISIIASARSAGLPIQPWTAMESPAITG